MPKIGNVLSLLQKFGKTRPGFYSPSPLKG